MSALEIVKAIIANWAIIAAGILIVLRFVESGILTGKWDIVSLIKEFFTLR